MTEEQLFRLQCTADVQKKLEFFTMDENMRMAYEPVNALGIMRNDLQYINYNVTD